MKRFVNYNLNDFTPLRYEDGLLIQKSHWIVDFLCRQFPVDFHGILALPELNDKEVIWSSESPGPWVEIDMLQVEEKNLALKIYHSYLRDVYDRCEALESQGNRESQEWSSMLRAVFNKAHNKVFYCERQILIVWGQAFGWDTNHDLLADELFGFKRPFEHLNSSDTEPATAPETPAEELESSLEQGGTEIPNTPRIPRTVKPRREGIFYDFLNAIARFLRRFWWLVLLLLGIFLYWYISEGYCGCSNKSSKNEREELLGTILPSQPGQVLPLDTTKITTDTLGRKVVSNIINIAPKDKSITIEDFSIELKQKFPSKDYSIVYYNKEAKYLQLKFPDSLQSTIKQTVKSKFPNRKLLIWDERIFNASAISADPVFKSKDQSWYLNALQMGQVWDLTQGDTSVIIAVIDDGFDLYHEDFPKSVVLPYNVTDKTKNVSASATRSHGTHVAGTIFATHGNNRGTAGIAPHCSLMPIQIGYENMQGIPSSYLVEAVLYAINHNADVINMSIASTYDPALFQNMDPEVYMKNEEKDEEMFWKDLFEYANSSNTTIVMAGGNQEILIGIGAMQRDASVLRVSASNSQGKRAKFSNWGKYSDVTAPGENIFNCTPENNYKFESGTSMASPIVAGIVGLLKSKNPKLTNAEIKSLLVKTGVKKEAKVGPYINPLSAIKSIK